jgi:hypothetical protein
VEDEQEKGGNKPCCQKCAGNKGTLSSLGSSPIAIALVVYQSRADDGAASHRGVATALQGGVQECWFLLGEKQSMKLDKYERLDKQILLSLAAGRFLPCMLCFVRRMPCNPTERCPKTNFHSNRLHARLWKCYRLIFVQSSNILSERDAIVVLSSMSVEVVPWQHSLELLVQQKTIDQGSSTHPQNILLRFL